MSGKSKSETLFFYGVAPYAINFTLDWRPVVEFRGKNCSWLMLCFMSFFLQESENVD
jgi:hypothetical protein